MSNQQLTTQQAAQYAVNAGFTGTALINMLSIGFAESGLQTQPPDNVNADGSHDRGLYQINSRWHPEVTDACAYDPQCASNAAFKISQQGKNFGSWSTYTSGAYLKYVQDVIKSIRGVTFKGQNPNTQGVNVGQDSPPPGQAGAQLITDPVMAAIQAAFKPLFDALPSFGIHIALFFGALMLVIVGLWVLTRDPVSDTGSTVNSGLNRVATKVVGGGKK